MLYFWKGYGRTWLGASPEDLIRRVERYEATCEHRLLSIVPRPCGLA